MKKHLKLMVVFAVVAALIITISISGCKPSTSTAEEKGTEEAVTEETATTEETAEESEVVAEEEYLYVVATGWYSYDWAKQVKYGAQMAEKFWNEQCGQNVRVEFTGPMDNDPQKIYEGLEAAIAMDPIGIYYHGLNMGEGKIVKPYQEAGGLIMNVGAYPNDYESDCYVGNDLVLHGEYEGKKAIELAGESFTYAVGSMAEAQNMILKRQGISSVLDKYPDVEYLGMVEDGATIPEGVQNYSAFLLNHPDVDVFITTSGVGGAALVTALEETGHEPGDIIVISSDMTAEHIEGVKKGYITAILGTELSNFGFYAITTLHLKHLNPCPLTTDDAATGHMGGPLLVALGLPWITADNVDAWDVIQEIE